MALAVRNAAKLKPELRLAQALSEYETLLNDSQKAQLRYSKAQQAPTLSSVWELSAELNQKAETKRRQCFGTRFQRVLEFVQRFACVLDTIIGGSQQPMASAAWGVVKLTLQVAADYSLYFEKISSLFLDIGRNCPRFEEYGFLFQQPRLQAALCEYSICLVTLCKKIVLLSQKSALSRLSASIVNPFEAEFGTVVSEITKLGDTVREEASLASKKASLVEANEASRFRKFSLEYKYNVTRELVARKKLKFLKVCSTYDFNQVSYRQARRLGTATWFLDHKEYKLWRSSEVSCSMICSGLLGSGKTVLVANVLEALKKQVGLESVTAYFFCRFDHKESTKARVIMGTITRQLLDSVDFEIPDTDASTSYSSFESHDFVRLLLGKLPRSKIYSIVLDGLDECVAQELKILLSSIAELLDSQSHTFKIFCTCRNDSASIVKTLLQPKYSLNMSQQGPIIEAFIHSTLERCLLDGELVLGDAHLIIDIQEKLAEGARDMFLWAKLQIESICSMGSDREILSALERLPQDLSETYNRILSRMEDVSSTQHTKTVRAIYTIVAGAKRPLHVDEIRECLNINPGDTSWDALKLSNDIRRTIASAGSMLFVEEETETVHFTHHSAFQYLTASNDGGVLNSFRINTHDADTHLGELCLTYLSLDCFENSLTRRNIDNTDLVQKLPAAVIDLPLSKTSSRLALSILRLKFREKHVDIRRITETESSSGDSSCFAFIRYALKYWHEHTRFLDYHKCNPGTWRLFERVCARDLDLEARFMNHEYRNPLRSTTIPRRGEDDKSWNTRHAIIMGHLPYLQWSLNHTIEGKELKMIPRNAFAAERNKLQQQADDRQLQLYEELIRSPKVHIVTKIQLVYISIAAGCPASFLCVWELVKPHWQSDEWTSCIPETIADWGAVAISSENQDTTTVQEFSALRLSTIREKLRSLTIRYLYTPLVFAVAIGQDKLVRTMLNEGHLAYCPTDQTENSNAWPIIVLEVALFLRATDIAHDIVANIDFSMGSHDGLGIPPLYYAIELRNYSIAKDLLARGAATQYYAEECLWTLSDSCISFIKSHDASKISQQYCGQLTTAAYLPEKLRFEKDMTAVSTLQ